MAVERLMENYTPVGDIISFMCSGVLLFLIMKVLYYSRDKKFYYMERALHCVFLASAVNATCSYFLNSNGNIYIVYILRDIYHISLILCLYFFIRYMKIMMDVSGPAAKLATVVTRVMFVAAIVFDVLSPITGFGLHYSHGEWHDPLLSPYNIFYIYAVIIFFIMLAFYSSRLIRALRTCLIVAQIAVTLIMVFQAINNVNSFSTFTFIIPILVVLILLHSKPFDDKTGALAGNCFDSFVKKHVEKKIHVDYMVLKLRMNELDRMPDELGKALNNFWHKHFANAFLFNLEHDLYILAIPRAGKNRKTEEKIVELTGQAFETQYTRFQIPYKVIGLFDIDFVENETDIIGIIRYLLSGMEENTIELVSEKKREELRLLKAIRENLADIEKKGDLDDDRVLVYCQPIKNMNSGRFDTAEALMRMSIPENGFLPPYLFIPLAEQYGYVHALTRVILNKVCKEIKLLEEEGYYFKRISVNFAASEIREENFCQDVLDIIRSNGISPSKIGIELTETQTESDFQIVRERMATLKNAGMTLYLDDVGTGYSNLDRIVKYDVDVVKFDRFFLLEAEKDPKVVKMMSHLSQAFLDLNYDLLYEGVENNDHQDLCTLCNADYIQGFMYSKPIPIKELRDFFDKTN